MNSKSTLNAIKVGIAAVVALGTTSCASLFGNRNCHCTHPGPCICCETNMGVQQTVVTRQQNARTAEQDSVLNALLDLSKYELKTYIPEGPKRLVWVDEPATMTIAQLNDSVVTGKIGILPKGVTTNNSENAIYLYFKEDANGKPEPLHLRIQYYADDPLNFYEAHFQIDGFDYVFVPSNFNRGKEGKRMIWENSDDVVKASDKDLIYALAHCNWAIMKLMAPSGINHNKRLSDEQLQAFRNMLELYLLKGGTIE